MNNTARRRLGRSDWVRAALDAIAAGGLSAVSVERLAVELGVTKGSFYAHFGGREELVDAALQSWEASHGVTGLAELAAIPDPAARLEEVLRLATTFSQSGAPSVHVSLLGEMHDPRVRGAVSRVTTARLDRLTATYRELGLSPASAGHRARLLYATYLGLLQMARETPAARLSAAETERFIAELRTLLVPPRAED